MRRHLRPELLAQHVDGNEIRTFPHMPESPAVAGFGTLHMSADLVNGAAGIAAGYRAIGPDARRNALGRIVKRFAGLHEAALDERAERNAGLSALGRCDLERFGGQGLGGIDPSSCGFSVIFLALDADEDAAELFGGGSRRARTEERIEH